ncbi:FASCICLIN-LIKE ARABINOGALACTAN PROTEIN [Salix koriyanagi]|uniref:FASCICLIN-LIKE ARABINOGALACTAN PROTEIN n=1 Tax=Salix koriyanagi TaxID=2511006 RepID=A0A9Q0PI34_9ROSI|nr:FASCICLIN-LIKE ARABINOGALACTAN PROTEIN [Salix koriyanagi]
MVPQFLFSASFILFFLLYCPTILAQSPAAAPAPAGPTNVTKVLEKGGQFSVFIRLLKATQEDVTLNGQLNNTNNAITIFAPSDSAFSSLKSGTLNSLNDQEKAELVQFHIIPQFLSSSQFQTVSNPLTTQAGSGGRSTRCFFLLIFLHLNLLLQHQHLKRQRRDLKLQQVQNLQRMLLGLWP